MSDHPMTDFVTENFVAPPYMSDAYLRMLDHARHLERERASLLAAVELAYLAILKHPHDVWRAQNQAAYCALRDVIAAVTEREAKEEDVQNDFEERALLQRLGKE